MSNIDKEQQPEQHNNQQNELNLDFDEFEPITPKKAVKTPEASASFFDKVKSVFSKKTTSEQTANDVETTSENHQHTEFAAEPAVNAKTNALQNLPTRYRRLMISLAVLLIIICLFIWLKPNSQPVDNFQSQENNLPIEFQPIDPAAVAEANTPPQPNSADAAAPTTSNEPTQNDNNAISAANTLTQEAGVPPTSQVSADNPPITTDTPTSANAVPPTSMPAEEKPTLSQEQIKQIEKKAYEEEHARLVAQAKARAEQRAREEFRAKQQKQKEQESRKAQALLNGKDVPVVEAKPVSRTTNKTTTHVASGSTKVLTVPAGTSLMQVFRDNHLNIADVNAMTKANGAGNALSSFKPGDKVSVNVNSQGRVSELQLPNGTKFIRQSDGSYIYKK